MLRFTASFARVVIIALASSLLPRLAQAQCFGWASGSGAAGADAPIYAQTVFDDGSGPALYIGGSFTSVGSVLTGPIARWDGTMLTPAGQGLQGTVRALAVYDSGSGPQLYAGGSFTLNGSAVNIVCWNGSAWAALAGGVNRQVWALTVHDDGTGPALIVGGEFWQANDFPTNTAVNHVGRWNGSAWSPLWTGVGGYMSGSDFVYSLRSYDDGSGSGAQLYAGGYFSNVGSNTQHAIARWDGANWLQLGPGLASSSTVHDMVVYDDGSGAGPRLALAGYLKLAGSSTVWPLAFWDGTSWSTQSGFSAGDTATCLCVHDDGTGSALFVGGRLGLAGPSALRIVRWDGATSLTAIADSLDLMPSSLGTFDPGTGPRLVACGYFSRVDGLQALHCASWTPSGWSRIANGQGLAGRPNAFALFDDGSGSGADLYAAGESNYPGSAGRVRHWDGAEWTDVGADFGGPVLALASFDDGSGRALYAAGRSATSGNFASRWNGSAWQSIPAPLRTVQCFAVHDDLLGGGPALYAGALDPDPFTVAPTVVWRWSSGAWVPLPNPGDLVASLCSFDDGHGPALFAGGNLTGGLVMRWDGASWTSIGSTSGWGAVSALIVFDDGSGPALYAGGEFTSMNGVPALRITRWNGTQWSAVGGGFNAKVTALCAFNEGFGAGAYLVAGGSFSSSQGTALASIARWNGSSWLAMDGDLSGTAYSGSPTEVFALATFDDGRGSGRDLYAAGNFLAAGAAPASFSAKWEGCGGTGTPYCFGDGSLALGCPCANTGAVGNGCANSVSAEGARLAGSGAAQPDTIVLRAEGMPPTALTIFLQGSVVQANGVPFGDGIRCVGGQLLRLSVKQAAQGAATYPAAGEASITARSAQLGAPIPSPGVRCYQAYYRDPDPNFCPSPAGATWNITSALRIVW
ncbi:MAG: hypothetical protein IPJ19_16595 [Planctomycetes bacterium]|nr:hypothetical protein [Planctomycetota bacterium]